MPHENSAASAPLTDVVEGTPTLTTVHVLFLDMAGFSRLRGNEQVAAQIELSKIVQNIPEVIAARSGPEMFLCRPAGDGMALLFFRDLLSPIRCALQIHGRLQADADRIKETVGAPIRLRMGIHTGMVTLVEDLNSQPDAAGDGIITAQRVMDLGDADHILLSADVARILLKIDPWPRYLRDLGTTRTKHRQSVQVFNLHGRLDGPFCGNPSTPSRMRDDARARNREARAQRPTFAERLRPALRPLAVLLLLGTVGGGGYYLYRRDPAPFVRVWHSLEERLLPRTAGAAVSPKPPRKPSTPRRVVARPVASVPDETTTRPPRVRVPLLVRAPLDTAVSLAESRGLRLVEHGPRTFQPDTTEGEVFQQTPAAGSLLDEDAVVTVRVSAGPPDLPGTSDYESTGDGGGEPGAATPAPGLRRRAQDDLVPRRGAGFIRRRQRLATNDAPPRF